jgi:hypothetical protein
MPLLDSRELAKRWCSTGIVDSRSPRIDDTIPHVRRSVCRFESISPELSEWWAARRTASGVARRQWVAAGR